MKSTKVLMVRHTRLYLSEFDPGAIRRAVTFPQLEIISPFDHGLCMNDETFYSRTRKVETRLSQLPPSYMNAKQV